MHAAALLFVLSFAIPSRTAAPQPAAAPLQGQGGGQGPGQGGAGGRQGRMPALPSMEEALKGVDLYPADRPTSVLHFYSVEGEMKAEALAKAFGELKTDKAQCRIAYGPLAAASRPKTQFVAVEAPAGAKPKDVERALERGGFKAEPVAATCFQGPQRRMGGGAGGPLGLSTRDWLLGTSGDLRWTESLLGFSEFFHVPGKLDAKQIADRVKKLGEPFGQGDIGKLVVDTFTWRLEGTLDEAVAKRLEKAVLKLPQVKRAAVDAASKTIAVEVALEGVRVSGMPVPLPVPEEFKAFGEQAAAAAGTPLDMPRVRFETTPLWDLLDKESLVARTIEKQAPAGEAPGQDGPPAPAGGEAGGGVKGD